MPREKIKFALWIKPETQLLVRDVCPRDNCKSQSEFIEKVIRFYAGYVETKSSLDYLTPTLSSALTGITHDSENRIARLLFKLTVEISMMMRIIADGLEVNESRLPGLRAEPLSGFSKGLLFCKAPVDQRNSPEGIEKSKFLCYPVFNRKRYVLYRKVNISVKIPSLQ